MSAVEKVAASAAFSSSSSIGQSNIARKSTTKLPHLHVNLNANPVLVEHDFSDNSSAGNSEFEEALKNIKALNGQGRYSDAAENESTEKRLDGNLLEKKTEKKDNSVSSNNKKDITDTQKLYTVQIAKKSTTQGNFKNSSHVHSSSIGTTRTSPLPESSDYSDSVNELKNDCDKSRTLKEKVPNDEKTEINLNRSNSLSVTYENKVFVGNGDHSGSDVKEFVSCFGLDEKIKDFPQKNSNSTYSKMLLKKKEDTTVESVTSTSDSQSFTKVNKTSSLHGNLFEKFGNIASPNHDDDDDDEKIKEETIEHTPKSNGQVESPISATLKSENNELENINISASNKEDTASSKVVNNFGHKEQTHLDSSTVDGVKPHPKLISEASPILLQFSTKDSDKFPRAAKCNEISENLENNGKKRSADQDDDLKEDFKDGEIAPVKRSRLDDVIGNLGSRIGIKLDSIPFVDELEESSKDSDSSDKPSEDTATTDDEEDQEKTSNLEQKTIRISEKELAEIVKKEVDNILNNKETSLISLQRKIDDLQATNESWKTQAKALQKQVLELTVLQQKQEKRKAAAVALKSITARNVAVQVDEGKTSQNLSPAKTVKLTVQKSSIHSPSFSSSSSISAPVAAPANVGITAISSVAAIHTSHWSRGITTQNTIPSSVSKPTMTSSILSNSTPLAVSNKKIPSLSSSGNQSRTGQVSSQLATTPAAAAAAASKFQSPTVKSLLDASRNTNLNQVSTAPAMVYQSSPGLLVVSTPTATTTTTARSILTKPVSNQVSTGSVKLIDLTGDDEAPLKNQANGKNIVHTAAITPIGPVRSGLVSQQVVRQVTPVQQPSVPVGTSFLLSTPAGTQIISPTVTQGLGAARPGVCQYVLTSTPNIRPGALVTVVPTTQNSSVRPPIVSSTIANAGSLPQLRPAQQTSSVASVDLTKAIRPPPPLQSAPMQQNTQRVVSTLLSSSSSSQSATPVAKHPAPLPSQPAPTTQAASLKGPPPRAGLRISRVAQGIVLSWNMALTENHAEISSYQLYAYQEGSAPPSTTLWKKVGDIKALPLPMACTLTQFHEGNKYHFAVRAVDTHGRVGPFSDPSTINLGAGSK